MPRRAVDADRVILQFLLRGTATWGELLKATGLSKAALSKNLNNLLVRGEIDAKDEGERRRLLRVSFKGFVLALATLPLPQRPSPLIPFKEDGGKTLHDYQGKLQEYQKRLDDIENIVRTEGKMLAYPLFEELDDLQKSLRHGSLRFFIHTANTMKNNPPLGGSWYLVLEKETKELQRLEDQSSREKEMEHELGHPIVVENTTEELEQQRKTTIGFRRKEDEIWRDEYAFRLLPMLAYRLKEKVNNPRLHEFWRGLLLRKRGEFEGYLRQLGQLEATFQP